MSALRYHCLFSGLVLAGAASAAAQQAIPARHTITHEDVWTMKRVGAPVVSPDGKWTVFSVTEPSYDESKTVSDLWIVPVNRADAGRRSPTLN